VAAQGPRTSEVIEEITRLLELPHRRLTGANIRRLVEQLGPCLSELRGRLRSVLRLRAGVGRRHPLSVDAVARQLGVPARRVEPLEVLAVQRLKRAEQATGCAEPATEPAPSAFNIGWVPSPMSGGGVASALYFVPAPLSAVVRSPGRPSRPFGVGRPPSSDALDYAIVLVALGGLLVVALLVADSQGLPVLPGRLSRRRRPTPGSSPSGKRRG
jgi:hypothetical protein